MLLKQSKCFFGASRTTYLGFVVSEKGVEADQQKVRAIQRWIRPSNAFEVRSFLGLASYYRRFIHGFARIASPLYQLTKDGVAFKWDAECERAFQALKNALTSAPVLAYPDFSKPFIL